MNGPISTSAVCARLMKALYDLTPFTLLDFPGTPAAILWFAGCNLRCLYCYNPEIVFGEARISEEEALQFLTKRAGLLEGVVLSGGEATLYPNLIPFCRTVRSLGYAIKLDTNGMRPDIIEKLIEENVIDYAALDFKAPDYKMAQICGGGSEERFWKSFDLLKNHDVSFEVRTTVHNDLMDENDIAAMAERLRKKGYDKPYYLQPFRGGVVTIGNLDTPENVNIEMLQRYGVVRC